VSHPKVIQVPIGFGEVERINGKYTQLLELHSERIPWEDKSDTLCVPWHGATNSSRTIEPTLPKLEFDDYMRELSNHKFVICQAGNGVDTHRVCEVLLMGSVPVVEHSGLDTLYSQWPVLLVDSLLEVDTKGFVWDEAKYQTFLDTIWLRDGFKQRLLN
jgi:hypothetical protein